MQIHVHLSELEEQITFDVDAMDTIRDKIQIAEAIPIDKLDLIYSGKELKDHQSVASYNICMGSTLYAIFPPIDVMLITVEIGDTRKIKLKVKSWYTIENVNCQGHDQDSRVWRKLEDNRTLAKLGTSHGQTEYNHASDVSLSDVVTLKKPLEGYRKCNPGKILGFGPNLNISF
ncbi:LOW QUALITY PROTEIN: hypothetical protein AQUCO_03800170v1 [Aquilegia coerulea]|uniref:Ubiquitin-like domain-containing protein n=1 Tax=Aquilegia coerulea TaxID=218851 RepID=A0A2G5CSW9_AQUCA|nr:LOW QUALITY PROTEIN: hypothetical protein AQUCO_03800170v1 [Aquilegia coerulea]